MTKIGIIYWRSVARDWRNGGKCLGRQGPQEAIVIVEEEGEEEEEDEREKRSYIDASITIILWTGLKKSHIQLEAEQTWVYV